MRSGWSGSGRNLGLARPAPRPLARDDDALQEQLAAPDAPRLTPLAGAAEAQVPLIETDETKANGLLTMSERGIQENIQTLTNSGITATAEEIFDTSILAEIGNMATPTA